MDYLRQEDFDSKKRKPPAGAKPAWRFSSIHSFPLKHHNPTLNKNTSNAFKLSQSPSLVKDLGPNQA
jgi:hypothetical protein